MHDISYRFTFILTSPTSDATNSIVVNNSTATSIDTHRGSRTRHGANIAGALEARRIASRGGTSLPNYRI